jgi:hypothetical protein
LLRFARNDGAFLVIPGLGEAENPESIFQRPVFMDSGLAAARRPGMTSKRQEGIG